MAGAPGEAPDNGGVATCRVHVLGIRVAVSCEEWLLPAVRQQLSPWTSDGDVSGSDTAAHLTGPPAGQSEGRYELHHGAAVWATAGSPEELMVALQQWIDAEVCRRVQQLIPVHAGVVGWRDRAILLPGRSGSGKSTLVSALVERGARYFSDELALIGEDGRVYAYPRHMLVRDSTGAQRSSPARSAGRCVPSRVGLALGLQFKPGDALAIAPIPASETMLLLLANTTHRLSSAGAVPRALLHAAGGAVGYTGARGDAAQAAAAILSLAERAWA